MKREYTYTYHVVVEDGEVVVHWWDDARLDFWKGPDRVTELALEDYDNDRRAAMERVAMEWSDECGES